MRDDACGSVEWLCRYTGVKDLCEGFGMLEGTYFLIYLFVFFFRRTER